SRSGVADPGDQPSRPVAQAPADQPPMLPAAAGARAAATSTSPEQLPAAADLLSRSMELQKKAKAAEGPVTTVAGLRAAAAADARQAELLDRGRAGDEENKTAAAAVVLVPSQSSAAPMLAPPQSSAAAASATPLPAPVVVADAPPPPPAP